MQLLLLLSNCFEYSINSWETFRRSPRTTITTTTTATTTTTTTTTTNNNNNNTNTNTTITTTNPAIPPTGRYSYFFAVNKRLGDETTEGGQVELGGGASQQRRGDDVDGGPSHPPAGVSRAVGQQGGQHLAGGRVVLQVPGQSHQRPPHCDVAGRRHAAATSG